RAGTGGIDAAHGGIGGRGPGEKLFRESRDLGRHVLGIDSRAAGGGIEHSAPGSRRSALSFRGHAGTMIPGYRRLMNSVTTVRTSLGVDRLMQRSASSRASANVVARTIVLISGTR